MPIDISRLRIVPFQTLGIVSVAALLLWPTLPYGAGVLLFGASCGILNAFLSLRASELLLENRRVSAFMLAGVLRIGLFGTLPVAFALHGPWWTMAFYFIGFFLPMCLCAGRLIVEA
jgi:hypothetical protein